jgi:phosphotransferase system  glucose/maltose/N-acetylglucosamine-specific IIC component
MCCDFISFLIFPFIIGKKKKKKKEEEEEEEEEDTELK